MKDGALHSLRAMKSLQRLSLLALILGLAACEDDRSAAEHIQRAKEHQAAGELRAATIELKNAVQLEPKNGDVRLLLGSVHLALFDPLSAEKELLRARELGATANSTVGLLAQAWLLLNENEKILAQATVQPDLPAATRLQIWTARGEALRRLGRLEESESAFKTALAIDPDSSPALVGLSRLALGRGKLSEARRIAQRTRGIAPSDPDLLVLLGDLAYQGGQLAEAGDAYQAALQGLPLSPSIRLSLARVQLLQNKQEAAIANLDKLLMLQSDSLEANYLRGRAAYETGDHKAAKDFVTTALQGFPDHLASLLVQGAANYRLGEWEQANRSLTRFLSFMPDHAVARKLLAAVQLSLGETSGAAATLAPLSPNSSADFELFAAVGAAVFEQGEFKQAVQTLEKASAFAPQNASVRTQLASSRIAAGDVASGIQELEQAIERHPDETGAVLRLVQQHLAQGQAGKALEVALKHQAQDPESVFAATLVGVIQVKQGQISQARAAFAQALALEPGAPEASGNLAILALREQRIEEARSLLNRALRHNPKHLGTLQQLAGLEFSQGNAEGGVERLEQAIAAQPQALPPRIYLARYYVESGQPRRAVELTEGLLETRGDDRALREVLGRAQLGAGDAEAAARTLAPLATAMAHAADAQFLLATAYREAGDQTQFKRQLERTLAIDPDHFDARVAMAEHHTAQKAFAEAAALIAELKHSQPERRQVWELDGNLALSQQRFADAITSFGAASQIEPASSLTLKTALAQSAMGQPGAAAQTLETWLKGHPQDLDARALLGAQHIAEERFQDAIVQFRKLLELVPDDPSALNNLAWATWRLGDGQAAIGYARRANGLAPDSPAIADTLGTILLSQDDPSGALPLLETAHRGMPDDPGVQFRYAQALAKTDRTDRAKAVLTDLLDQQKAFAERGEAERLLHDLR